VLLHESMKNLLQQHTQTAISEKSSKEQSWQPYHHKHRPDHPDHLPHHPIRLPMAHLAWKPL